jgi:hypothetical protein
LLVFIATGKLMQLRFVDDKTVRSPTLPIALGNRQRAAITAFPPHDYYGHFYFAATAHRHYWWVNGFICLTSTLWRQRFKNWKLYSA